MLLVHECHILKVMEYMKGDNFKPNCAAVCLDFMIRHSQINPDTGNLIMLFDFETIYSLSYYIFIFNNVITFHRIAFSKIFFIGLQILILYIHMLNLVLCPKETINSVLLFKILELPLFIISNFSEKKFHHKISSISIIFFFFYYIPLLIIHLHVLLFSPQYISCNLVFSLIL